MSERYLRIITCDQCGTEASNSEDFKLVVIAHQNTVSGGYYYDNLDLCSVECLHKLIAKGWDNGTLFLRVPVDATKTRDDDQWMPRSEPWRNLYPQQHSEKER